MRVRHVPMRTCLGTGEKLPKREMVRIVCTADGRIMVDESGKAAGSRGAYVSRSQAALKTALSRKRFEAEFECALNDTDREALLEYFRRFG